MNHPSIKSTSILGVPVSLVWMELAVSTIRSWASAGTGNYVCIRDVHGIMLSQSDPDLLAIHRKAGLVTPDGMPLVWVCHLRGFVDVQRVCGADLVMSLCQHTQQSGLRHYFYGGKPGVAERMAAELKHLFPDLEIAGTKSPPFHAPDQAEDARLINEIVKTKPHIVWVGLSTPKQEFWMRDHVGLIPGATLIGVGAAFDFVAGDVKRAPIWMQHRGLEWLHRLMSEPRRLWRRYLVLGPLFILKIANEQLQRSMNS